MKKLQLYLSSLLLLFLFAGTATAQITSIGQRLMSYSELESGKQYVFKAVGTNAQGFVYEDENHYLCIDETSSSADLLKKTSTDANKYIFKISLSSLFPDTPSEPEQRVWSVVNVFSGRFLPTVSGDSKDNVKVKAQTISTAEPTFIVNNNGNESGTNLKNGEWRLRMSSMTENVEAYLAYMKDGLVPFFYFKGDPAGSAKYEIYEVNNSSWQTVTVNHILRIPGRKDKDGNNAEEYTMRTSGEQSFNVGDVVYAFSNAFLKLAKKEGTDVKCDSSVTITADTKTVTFYYEENLPFYVSNDPSSEYFVTNGEHRDPDLSRGEPLAAWYAIEINGTENSYMWKNEGLGTYVSTPATYKLLTNGIPDDQLWCFKGNIVDGFKIYSKIKENDQLVTLNHGTNHPELSTSDENNVWKLMEGTNGYTFYFEDAGGNIKPIGFGNVDGNTRLNNYLFAGTAQQTECKFLPRVSFLYEFVRSCKSFDDATDKEFAIFDVLGNSSITSISNIFVSNAIDLYEGHNYYKFDIGPNMQSAVKYCKDSYVSHVVTAPACYVFLCHDEETHKDKTKALQEKTLCAGADAKGNPLMMASLGNLKTSMHHVSNVNTLEPTEEGNGNFYVKYENMYLKYDDATSKFGFTSEKAEARAISFEYLGYALFYIRDAKTNYYLTLDKNGILTIQRAAEDGSRWHLVRADKFYIDMKAPGKDFSYHFSTACYPFTTKLDAKSPVAAYIATKAENNEITLGTLPTDGNGNQIVPAHTPVMLLGKQSSESEPVMAMIMNEDYPGYGDINLFEGTLFRTFITGDVEAYVLAQPGTTAPGFYPLTAEPNERYIPANKAYLKFDKQEVTALRLSMKFGGVVSGIESTVEKKTEGEKVYYDLNGRRVLYPSRGIYINNFGEKVFLK